MRISKMYFSFLLVLFFLFFFPFTAGAEEFTQSTSEIFSVVLDKTTAVKGYTVSVFDNTFKVGIPNGVLDTDATVILKKNPVFEYSLASGQHIISDIVEYDIRSSGGFSNVRPLMLELSFVPESRNFKKIYFWDTNHQMWRMVPGQSNNIDKFVRGVIHLPFARLAVIEDTQYMEEGQASWYTFRACDCAASPEYERGTKLRVINTDNNKSIVVIVNDVGPDRSAHPERIIDLDTIAFKKLAPLGAGVLNVKVEPIENRQTMTISVLTGAKEEADLFQGRISARAASVIDAKTGELLWGKNYTETLPIASLTKLISAQVFLDTHTPWDKVVEYKKTDDEPGSRLYVYPGETLTAKDLYYSMLVSSTNNAVNTLVRSTALGRGQFVDLMNKKAATWGLTNTRFSDPTGLDPKNVSTAYEVALLSREVLRNFEVLEATTLPSYTFRTLNTNEKHVLKNTNLLVHRTSLYLTGGKTGYLDEAGYNLMARAKNASGGEVIVVVLDASSDDERTEQTQELLRWGLENVSP